MFQLFKKDYPHRLFCIKSWLFQRTASVNNHDTIIVSDWPNHLVLDSLQWNMVVNLDQVFAENSTPAAACWLDGHIGQSDGAANVSGLSPGIPILEL